MLRSRLRTGSILVAVLAAASYMGCGSPDGIVFASHGSASGSGGSGGTGASTSRTTST
jgi:hypothetical protein